MAGVQDTDHVVRDTKRQAFAADAGGRCGSTAADGHHPSQRIESAVTTYGEIGERLSRRARQSVVRHVNTRQALCWTWKTPVHVLHEAAP